MTLEQRRKKINDIIEEIREENNEKDFIVSRQSVEIAKLPDFPSNWRRKCNIHPYKSLALNLHPVLLSQIRVDR